MSLYSLIAITAFASLATLTNAINKTHFQSTIEIEGYYLGVPYNCSASGSKDEVHLDFFYAQKGDEWNFEQVPNQPAGVYRIASTNAKCGFTYLSASKDCLDDYLYIVPSDDGSGRQWFRVNQTAPNNFTLNIPSRPDCFTKNFLNGEHIYPKLS